MELLHSCGACKMRLIGLQGTQSVQNYWLQAVTNCSSFPLTLHSNAHELVVICTDLPFDRECITQERRWCSCNAKLRHPVVIRGRDYAATRRSVALWDPGGIATLRPAGSRRTTSEWPNGSRKAAPWRFSLRNRQHVLPLPCCCFRIQCSGFFEPGPTHDFRGIRPVRLTHPNLGIRPLGSLLRCAPVTPPRNGSLAQLLRAASFASQETRLEILPWKMGLFVRAVFVSWVLSRPPLLLQPLIQLAEKRRRGYRMILAPSLYFTDDSHVVKCFWT